MSVLSNLVNNYADDVVRSTVSNYGDDILKSAGNVINNQIDDMAKLAMNKKANVPLEKRLIGDSLLDAQDLVNTIKGVGGQVDDFGNIRLYHRTNPESAKKIIDSGKMFGKEDGLFFSTSRNGINNTSYGNTPIAFDIPAENLMLDDIFADEASIKMPLKRAGQYVDVADFINNSPTTKLYRGQMNGIDDFYYNSYTDPSKIKNYASETIGNGYFMTPKREAATAFGVPLEIEVPSERIMSKNTLQDLISEAEKKVNDIKEMERLYTNNPAYAEYLDEAAAGHIPAIAKWHNMPFIENNTANGQDLAEILFYKDVDPELTRTLLSQLIKKS